MNSIDLIINYDQTQTQMSGLNGPGPGGNFSLGAGGEMEMGDGRWKSQSLPNL